VLRVAVLAILRSFQSCSGSGWESLGFSILVEYLIEQRGNGAGGAVRLAIVQGARQTARRTSVALARFGVILVTTMWL
jgi:hypothetical protein